MSRTETFRTLLEKSESPVQSFILMAQLELLRRQDRQRREVEK
jgi:hypothetical protein